MVGERVRGFEWVRGLVGLCLGCKTIDGPSKALGVFVLSSK